jgi:copper chaperone CopZ
LPVYKKWATLANFVYLPMKTPKLLALLATFGAAAFFAVAADAPAPDASTAAPAAPATYSVTLTSTHMCCGNCVKGAATAVKGIDGVTAVGSQADKSIVVTAPDKATAQKAVDALTGAGFYGKSSSDDIKVSSDTGATATKVSSITISNLHLCCGKCVTAVNGILSGVSGVTANDAKTGAKSFTVTGDFSPKDVMDALQKGGLTGKVVATVPEAKS